MQKNNNRLLLKQILRAYECIWSKNLFRKMPKSTILATEWSCERSLISLPNKTGVLVWQSQLSKTSSSIGIASTSMLQQSNAAQASGLTPLITVAAAPALMALGSPLQKKIKKRHFNIVLTETLSCSSYNYNFLMQEKCYHSNL